MIDQTGLLAWAPVLIGLFAVGMVAIGIGVLLKRTWARREFEALRKRYLEMDVTDPHYNAVRALYMAAVIDHQLQGGSELDIASADGASGADGAGVGGGD